MTSNKHPFQKWIDENGINDVRFFPQNPSRSTPTELMNEAMSAVNDYEEGRTVPYEDGLVEHSM